MLNKNAFDKFAAEIRVEALKAFKPLLFGHVGGVMSIVETLAVLYGGVMNIDPANPKKADRDRFILSKGHAGPALYATLALKGFFDKKELATVNQGGTILPSHCDMNLTPGIDMTTGSLGQGISAALGLCLGNRLDGIDSYTYCMMGDGEMNEGQVWEAVLAAAQYKLDNLIMLIDYNKYQLDGTTDEVMSLGDLKAKFEQFGWDAHDIDGHDTEAICSAIKAAKAAKKVPRVIVLNTLKGMGCNFAVEPGVWNHFMVFGDEAIDGAIAEAAKAAKSFA